MYDIYGTSIVSSNRQRFVAHSAVLLEWQRRRWWLITDAQRSKCFAYSREPFGVIRRTGRVISSPWSIVYSCSIIVDTHPWTCGPQQNPVRRRRHVFHLPQFVRVTAWILRNYRIFRPRRRWSRPGRRARYPNPVGQDWRILARREMRCSRNSFSLGRWRLRIRCWRVPKAGEWKPYGRKVRIAVENDWGMIWLAFALRFCG